MTVFFISESDNNAR